MFGLSVQNICKNGQIGLFWRATAKKINHEKKTMSLIKQENPMEKIDENGQPPEQMG